MSADVTEVEKGSGPSARSSSRLSAVLLAVLGLPSLPLYFGVAFSLTPGFVILTSALFALQLKRGALAQGVGPVSVAQRDRAALVVSVLVALHFCLAALLGPTDALRALGSMVPLVLLLLAGPCLANVFISVPDVSFHRGVLRCFMVLCLLALAGIVGLAPPAPSEWRKPVFPFSEPATFALAFIPVLVYVCVAAGPRQRVGRLLVGVAAGFLLQNLTLMIGCLLAAAVSLRWRALFMLAVPFAVGAAQLDLSYYAERLSPSGETQNLSNLVYIQGWQMIGESMERSRGFGIGFQQLGVQGTDVPIAELLRALRDGEDMNLLDGGFVFAKVASDFGVLGVTLALIYIGIAVRSFLMLRRIASRRIRTVPAVCIAHCVVVAYSVELLVRGSGYFTSGSLLLVSAFWMLWKSRRIRFFRPMRTDRSPTFASAA